MTYPIRNGRLRTPQGNFFGREVGHGSTVLMLHGSWADGSQWLPLMTQLGSQFHCLAPDLLGFGESSRLPAKAASIETEAAGLQAYLTQLRVKPQVIVADSLGAWVAIRYCLQHPGQVQQLVLMAPEGLSHPQLNQRWRQHRWLASPWALRYWVVCALAPLIKGLGGDRWLKSVHRRRRQLRNNVAACRLLFQRRSKLLKSEQLNASLPHLKTPILLLHPHQASTSLFFIHQLVQELAPQCQVQDVEGNELTLWETNLEEICAVIQSSLLNEIAP
jgi:pimeloyl-ACP methyl ester carboxylesterase